MLKTIPDLQSPHWMLEQMLKRLPGHRALDSELTRWVNEYLQEVDVGPLSEAQVKAALRLGEQFEQVTSALWTVKSP